MTSLLPANATATERAIEAATNRPVPVPVGDLWSPDRCPAPLLPWLAWALSVDDWDATWSDEVKRGVIAASIEIHRHKGTRWAVRRALAAACLGGAQIIEQAPANRHDGAITYAGAETHAASDHWAEYRVILSRPMSFDQAARVRSILASVAPARCHLKALDFTRALNLYDAAVTHDGSYSHGVA